MNADKALSLFLNSYRGAKAPATVTWYHSKLSPLITHLAATPIEDVTSFDLDAWRAGLSQEAAMQQNTLRGYGRAAKTFFRWLKKKRIIEHDPSADFELPAYVRVPREGLSEEDRDRLFYAARDNPRDLAIMRFLADTGCRVGGIASLTIDRLYLKIHRALVKEKGRGGQNKYRTVFFGDETAHALAVYLVNRPSGSSHPQVFLETAKGGRAHLKEQTLPMSTNAIYHMLKRYAEPLNIPLANPHNWRHGFARGCTKRGIPLQTLAQLLGHSSVQVTADIYGTLDPDQLQQMHETYTWLSQAHTLSI